MQLTARVNAPLEQVFDVFTDIASTANRLSGVKRIELLTDDAVGVGTRWRETREMFKREATETLEFTQFDPPGSCTVECESCGALWTTVFTFTPEDASGATRVEQVMTARSLTFKARLLAPLSLLFKGAVRKAMAKDMADLQRCCEAPTT